jgi:RHS repeat-associated protein
VRKQGGQVEVRHYIDGAFEYYRWGSGTGVGQNNQVHVMENGQRVALVRFGAVHPDDRGPAVQFHLGDHLGSSNLVADSSGALVNREEYTPYGETSFGSFAKKRYRFTGNERDEESGLNYHGARYCATWLGRWTSSDPKGIAGGANAYSYAFGNLLIFTDPFGTEPETPGTYDQEGNLTLNPEIIEIQDRDPRLHDYSLQLWERNGVINPVKKPAEFEHELASRIYNNPFYDPVQSEANWALYPEESRAAWSNYWKQSYKEYLNSESAKESEKFRTIDAAANVGSAIPGAAAFVTAAVTGPVQLVFSGILAGSTSEGGYSGCGLVAGLGPLPSSASGVGRVATKSSTRSVGDDFGATRWLEGGTGKAFEGHGIETRFAGTTTVPFGTTVFVPPRRFRRLGGRRYQHPRTQRRQLAAYHRQ